MRYIVKTISWSKERLDNCQELKRLIPSLEINVSDNKDAYVQLLDICKDIDETGAIVLEDDILLCENFCEKIEKIIEEFGGNEVINFFEKPKKYFKTCHKSGSQFLWAQCVYLPPHFPSKMIEHYEEFKNTKPLLWRGNAVDRLIGYALAKEKMKYWSIRPCLVQHLPYKSIAGNRPTNRQTPYFIDDLIKNGVDYDSLE